MLMVKLVESEPALLVAMHAYVPASPYEAPLTVKRPVTEFTSDCVFTPNRES